MLRTLFNPYMKIAGFPAMGYGCIAMFLTAAIAAPCGVNFVGSLNIHVARPTPFGIIFTLLVLGWLIASVCFLVTGCFSSPSKIRAVDVFGTLALARAPFLIAAPFGLLPGLWNIDPQLFQQPEKIPPEIATSLAVATVVFLLVDIWVVIWSYNAFAVSANVKNKGIFAAVLIVSEFFAITASGALIASLPPHPKPENQAALEASTPEDAEQVEIAKRFVQRILSNAPGDPLQEFQVTEAMKQYVASNSFKEWAKKIATDYGKPGAYEKIEIIRREGDHLNVFLYFRCERYPIKMWVTFDGKTISGFHWDTWKDGSVAAIPPDVQWTLLYSLLVLPILIVGIIYFGEKWRNRWVEFRIRNSEPFDVRKTIGTVYRESQNPLWMYLLMGVTLIPVLVLAIPHEPLDLYTIAALTAGSLGITFLIGGMAVEVGEHAVDVKWSGIRWRILRIPLDSIASVEETTFRPMRDFGGWGIKQGWGDTWAYSMSGTRGVFIQTKAGKKYLLGSDSPDHLAAVIRSRIVDGK